MTRDEAITALVGEMHHEIFRVGDHPALGIPVEQVQRWADTLSALGGRPETGWQPIATAPKDGTHIDLWAKAWSPAFDKFFYQRFPDCVWMAGDSMCNRAPYWLNLDKDWCPTHWQPLPSPPLQEQP